MEAFNRRILIVSFVTAGLLCVLVGRLFVIQVLRGQEFSVRSKDQSQRRIVLEATRGGIVDRKGVPMARSVGTNPVASPARLQRVSLRRQDNVRLGRYGGQWHTGPARREYPLGALAGPVLGFVGRDGYGLAGIEFAFNDQLLGEDGWLILKRDGRNERYPKIGLPHKPPTPGADIVLTIDSDVQRVVETVLKNTVRRLNAAGGMCIVMDPRTGEILAMADEPGFDPNHASRYSLHRRLSDCVGYTYEPGSTFKPIVAAAALQEGLLSEEDTLDGGDGEYKIHGEIIRDRRSFGKLTFSRALSLSSNVCFAALADKLGSSRLYEYTRDFGFGAKTGIQLPGEERGIVHPVEEWSERTRVTMAIGQEVGVTLMQMALAFSCIAHDGILLQPRIIRTGGRDRRAVRRVLSSDVARRTRRMMKNVVTEGTGKRAQVGGIEVGGKTGTSQKVDPDSGGYSRSRFWSSFMGFVPVEKPILVCGVVIDEPAGGESGGAAAAPAFREIMTKLVSHPGLHYAEQILKGPEGRSDTTGESFGPALKRADVAAPPGGFSRLGAFFGMTADSSKDSLQRAPTDEKNARAGSGDNRVVVPSCVGKDARDATNDVNLLGLRPHIVGQGIVRRQAPRVGTITTSASPCTLYCVGGG